MEIRDLLLMCIEKSASDLHITEKEPPILRIDGRLVRLEIGPRPILVHEESRDFNRQFLDRPDQC